MRCLAQLPWLLLTGWCSWAAAQPAAQPGAESATAPEQKPAQNMDAGSRLIEQGIAQRKAGNDRAALQSFQRAFELSGSPRALAQLALAEQAMGRWLDAHEHLATALNRDDPWILERSAELRAALDAIRSELAALEVSCNVEGASVYVDGRWLGRTPSSDPFRIVAGQSVIQVTAPGYFSIARHVQVDAGGLARIDVTLTPEPPPRVASEPPAAPTSSIPERPTGPLRARADATAAQPSLRDPLMYGSVGLAALGAAVGVTGYIIREVNIAVYNDDSRCDVRADVRRSVECASEASAWRSGEKLAIAGVAAATVFGALGGYLWLTRSEPDAAAEIACGVGPVAVTCTGAF